MTRLKRAVAAFFTDFLKSCVCLYRQGDRKEMCILSVEEKMVQ